MRSTLRHLFLAPVLMAAAAFTATAAHASETLVKVPFSFTTAGKTLPAGNYSVDRQLRGAGTLVTLRSMQTLQQFTYVLGPGDDAPANQVTLTFDADSHALRTVQYGSLTTGRLDKKGHHAEHAPIVIVPGQ